MIIKFVCLLSIIFAIAAILNFMLGKNLPGKGAFVNIIVLLFSLVLSLTGFKRYFSKRLLLPQDIDLNYLDIFFYRMGLNLRVDALTILTLIVASASLIITLIALARMIRIKKWAKNFNVLISLSLSALYLLIISNNMLLSVICLQIITFSIYAINAVCSDRLYASKFQFYEWIPLIISDILLYTAIVIIFLKLGTLNITQLDIQMKGGFLDHYFMSIISLLLLTGILGRLSFLPLYAWLPSFVNKSGIVPGFAATIFCIFSGMLFFLKSSIFIVNDALIMKIILVVGAINAVFWIIAAIISSDLKNIAVCLALSICGCVVFVYGMGFYDLVVYMVLGYVCIMTAFLVINSFVAEGLGSTDLNHMGGLAKRIPFLSILSFFVVLILASFPFTLNYFSSVSILNYLILDGSKDMQLYWYILILFLTTVFSIKYWMLLFFGQPRDIKLFWEIRRPCCQFINTCISLDSVHDNREQLFSIFR